MTDVEPAKEEMTFTEHLAELRDRLMRVAGALLLGFMVAFAYRDPIFQFLSAPMHEALAEYGVYTFRAIEITETIFVYLKMSVVAGFILTLPVTFYQLWAFIAPGLLETEKQAVMPLLFFSTFFFLLGAYFAFEVIIPFIAEYLAQLTLAADTVQMDVTVASAFGFSLKLILAFGIAFELPLVMFFLSVLGLVDPAKYVKFYRYFILVSFIVGAILTPPDPISQLLMAVPLNLLYWVGVGASLFARRKNKDKASSIGSRVWLLLSLALFSIGGVLAGSTWYLGRSDSALRHIPNDAVWVVSIRPPTTTGAALNTSEKTGLYSALGLGDDIPYASQIVLAKGPTGKQLIILADACQDTAPTLGDCAGDDLLIGGDNWLDAPRQSEQTLEDSGTIRDLALSSPSFAWTRVPASTIASLLPGHDALRPELSRASVTLDLRQDDATAAKPTLEIRLHPKESSVLTAMQNRIDLWQTEQLRQVEQLARDRTARETNRRLIRLMDELLTLEDARFDVLKNSATDPEKWATIGARSATLRAALAKASENSLPAEPKAPEGQSIVERLGANIAQWRALVDGDALLLTIELTGPKLLNEVIRVLRDGMEAK